MLWAAAKLVFWKLAWLPTPPGFFTESIVVKTPARVTCLLGGLLFNVIYPLFFGELDSHGVRRGCGRVAGGFGRVVQVSGLSDEVLHGHGVCLRQVGPDVLG